MSNKSTDTKLNIACFNNPVDGWVNIDITPHAVIARYPLLRELLYRLKILTPERYKEHIAGKFNNISRHDIRKGLPFPDESCVFIYSSHFIEHLFYPEVVKYFRECHRVLKSGGIVRTCVPDFYNYTKKYLSFRQEKQSLIFGDYLNDYKLLEECAGFLQPFFAGIYPRDKSSIKISHKSLWDDILLGYTLRKVGFINLRKYSFREGKLSDLEKFENRRKGSIYIEAEK